MTVPCSQEPPEEPQVPTEPPERKDYFVGLNGFGTVYVLQRVQANLQFLPISLADAARFLEGVPVVQNESYVKAMVPLPARLGTHCLHVNGNSHYGPRSSEIRGFTSGHLEACMGQLRAALLAASQQLG